MIGIMLLTALFMPYTGNLYDRFRASPLALVGFPIIGIPNYCMSVLKFDTYLFYCNVVCGKEYWI